MTTDDVQKTKPTKSICTAFENPHMLNSGSLTDPDVIAFASFKHAKIPKRQQRKNTMHME